MKGLLKNLGLILILVGAVILVACSFTGNVNNNAILGTSAVLIVIGLISYILNSFFIIILLSIIGTQ